MNNKITAEMSKQIVQLYTRDRLSQTEIAKKFGLSQGGIQRHLNKLGISGKDRRSRQHYFNEDFFETWSHDMAYILGFITADGNVDKYTLSVKLANQDVEILEFIREKIGNVPITHENFNSVRIRFNSTQMVKSLEKYNVIPNKTFKLTKIKFDIPIQYRADYVRGFFDGDGTVWKRKNNFTSFSIYSVCKEYLESINEYIGNIALFRVRSYINDPIRKPQYILIGNKVEVVKKFRDFIYSTNGFSLNRKREKFYSTCQSIADDPFDSKN